MQTNTKARWRKHEKRGFKVSIPFALRVWERIFKTIGFRYGVMYIQNCINWHIEQRTDQKKSRY